MSMSNQEKARLPALLVGLVGILAALVLSWQIKELPTVTLLLLIVLMGMSFLPATLVLIHNSDEYRTPRGALIACGSTAIAVIGATITCLASDLHPGQFAAGVAMLVLPLVVFLVMWRRVSTRSGVSLANR